MPSTYSPSLRIELIGAGEQAGTWNTTTNTNLGTLLDTAIAGNVAVSVTSANQALTANNGATDQARQAILTLSTTTVAAFAIYAPPQPKEYIVNNTSAYAATIYNSTVLGNTTAAGTGVAVAAGNKIIVFSDGTNFSTISLPSPGTGTVTSVTGAGTVNGITLTGTVTTSGNLTLGGSLSNVSLSSQVTGTLPIANGGTGTTSTTFANLTTNVTGTLPVANGGTGASTLLGAGIPTLSGSNAYSGSNTYSGTNNFTNVTTFSNIANFTSPANFITYAGGASFGQATPNATYAIYCQPNASGTGGLATQNQSVYPGHTSLTQDTAVPMINFYYGPLASASFVGNITTNGSTTSYNTSSDYRLKENVAPLANAVTRLKQLAPKNFTWKQNPNIGTVEGFIAHELQAVVPDAVYGEKDAVDQDGKPKYQGVDSSMLVALLTAALQEALARIEALEAKVG